MSHVSIDAMPLQLRQDLDDDDDDVLLVVDGLGRFVLLLSLLLFPKRVIPRITRLYVDEDGFVSEDVGLLGLVPTSEKEVKVVPDMDVDREEVDGATETEVMVDGEGEGGRRLREIDVVFSEDANGTSADEAKGEVQLEEEELKRLILSCEEEKTLPSVILESESPL